jgi:hypothetical protein
MRIAGLFSWLGAFRALALDTLARTILGDLSTAIHA